MPDFFYKYGRVHIIRSSPGYDEALVGLSEADKTYLRDGTTNYTVASPGREERIAEHKALKEAGKLKYTRNVFRPTRERQEHQFAPRLHRRQIW